MTNGRWIENLVFNLCMSEGFASWTRKLRRSWRGNWFRWWISAGNGLIQSRFEWNSVSWLRLNAVMTTNHVRRPLNAFVRGSHQIEPSIEKWRMPRLLLIGFKHHHHRCSLKVPQVSIRLCVINTFERCSSQHSEKLSFSVEFSLNFRAHDFEWTLARV